MSSAKLNIKRLDRKLESRLAPGPITKFFNAINPMTSLGKVAGKNFHENSLKISIIMLFSLTIAIISTIMFTYMGADRTNTDFRVRQHFVLAVMVISWFVFLNFTFLVLEGTRLFNILLFIAIITIMGSLVSDLDQNSTEAKLGISIIALASVPLTILCYYYLASEGDEVVQLKTLEREKRNKEEIKAFVADYKKKVKEEVKKELTEDITSKEGIKGRIADAYIDALVEGAKKNVKVTLSGGGEKSKKDKEKEKKEKEKEKKEEDE
jgi:hypothetical protein